MTTYIKNLWNTTALLNSNSGRFGINEIIERPFTVGFAVRVQY